MTDQRAWYREDAFWALFEPILFNQQRQSRAKEEVKKIERLLHIEHSAQILDLCCGNGRHSLVLSEQGYAVTGVDRTERFIAAAKLAARQRNLTATFEVADMREHCRPNRYDVILNLFGSFGYFDDSGDDQKVVENMYASLRPGGQFLIETMGKEILARDFPARDWSEEGEWLLLSEKKVVQNWSRVETRWIAIRGAERVEHRVSVRSYSAVELSALLNKCGFSEVRVYGNLDGAEYDQAAERLVVAGRKSAVSS